VVPSCPFKMISFSNINKQYGKQLLFVDASFQLNPGEKVGLVGPNGAGKTTLFRMVVGEETPDEGAVSVPKKLTIGYFRQDVEEMRGYCLPMERGGDLDCCFCMSHGGVDTTLGRGLDAGQKSS